MKHMEIEHKYLLVPCKVQKYLKELGIEYRKIPIEQFYLRSNETGVNRYRRYGDRYIHTQKRGSGVVREEIEEEVSEEEFLQKKEQNRSGLIEKIRYIFKYQQKIYELDRFKGPLKGLNFLEIEFENPEEEKRFDLPEPLRRIVLEDVSERSEFSNGAISRTMRIPIVDHSPEASISSIGKRKDLLKASIRIDFHPFLSIRTALRVTIYELAKVVQANRLAIAAGDPDPERLHQFRVGIRKLRTLLSLFRKEFDPQWLKIHRENLSRLMKRSNAKRDLDVYLENLREYELLLGKKERKELAVLRKILKKEDSALANDLKEFMLSDELQEELESLLRILKEEHCFDTGEQKSDTPLIISVKGRLKKHSGKTVDIAEALNWKSNDKDFHRLRIAVKKLRYLAEFFSSIFEESAYGEFLKRLKSIQTQLGEHQDLTVQIRRLDASIEEMRNLGNRGLLEALMELKKILKRKKEGKRKECLKTIESLENTRRSIPRMVCGF